MMFNVRDRIRSYYRQAQRAMQSGGTFDPRTLNSLFQWLFPQEQGTVFPTGTTTKDVAVSTPTRTIQQGRAYLFDGSDDALHLPIGADGSHTVSALTSTGDIASNITITFATDHYVITSTAAQAIWNIKVWKNGYSPSTAEQQATEHSAFTQIFAWLKCDEQDGATAYSCCLGHDGSRHHASIENATLSTFHSTQNYHSWQNEVGYTYSAGVYLPRDESDPTKDAAGNTLQYSDRVPYNLNLVESPCFTGDGSTAYVLHQTANIRSADSAGTISFWIKTSSTGVRQYALASADNATANYYFGVGLQITTGFPCVAQKNNDTEDLVRGSTNCADGAWHHVIVQSSGTAYTIYVDGGTGQSLTVVTGANSGDWFADTTLRDNITLAALKTSSVSGYLTGQLCDVRVWSKALSSAERALVYAKAPVTDGLVAWWPLAEGAGGIAYDKVSGYHGTISGTLTSVWANTQNIFHENLLRGFSSVPHQWVQVAPQLNSQTYIYSLAVLNDKLYGGTYPHGLLFEWNGVDAWTQVAGQLNSQIRIFSLAVLNSKLYGGTGDQGLLFEWNGVDAWTQVAGQLNSQTHIHSLAVLNGTLYGGTYPHGMLFEWNGVDAWTQVAGQLNSQTYIWSLAVFEDKLYGGTIPNGLLFEWNGVDAWTQVAGQLNSQTHIYNLAVLNGKLYGGTYPNGLLFEWNGTDAWTQVAGQLNSQTHIFSLAMLNSKLYGGTYPHGLLFEWNGVDAWTQVAGQLNSQTHIFSLAVLNSKLYGGTATDGLLFEADTSLAKRPASTATPTKDAFHLADLENPAGTYHNNASTKLQAPLAPQLYQYGRYSGGCATFGGTNEWIDIGNTGLSVKAISLWVYVDSITAHTDYVLDLNGTDYLTIVNGTITLNGFAAATTAIYVNGVAGTTIAAATWTHLFITSSLGFTASDLDVGRLEGTGLLTGRITDLRVFVDNPTTAEIWQMFYTGKALGDEAGWWNFQEDALSVAYDVSAGDHDGAINGTLSTYYANTQVCFSYNRKFGYTLSGSTKIPALPDGSLDAIGGAIGVVAQDTLPRVFYTPNDAQRSVHPNTLPANAANSVLLDTTNTRQYKNLLTMSSQASGPDLMELETLTNP